MNCTEYKELLVAYIEGLLEESEKQAVAEHLKDCSSCRSQVEELRGLHDRLIANGKSVAHRDLENDVMNRIVREQNVRLKTAAKATEALKTRRTIMKSPIARIAAAAAVIVVAALGINFIMKPSVTWAQVVEPILNAKTVVLDFVVGNEESGPVMHDIVAGSKIRRTISNMNNVMVIDLDSAKLLTLDPPSKSAAYADIEGPLKEGTKNILELVRNSVSSIKGVPVEELGRQDIDGHKAVGFRVSNSREELTIWADADTAKPIRIELGLGQSQYVIKNIEFDVSVDASLVSMDPPAGYTLNEKTFNLNQFTEQDFVTVLRLWAEQLLGGSFPQSLSVAELMSLTPQMGAKIGQLNLPDEEKTKLGMTMGRGFIFFQQLDPTGVKWTYAGAGVKLGDASKAIFWYQPKGSATWRVIYGDLSVKDVAQENLPK